MNFAFFRIFIALSLLLSAHCAAQVALVTGANRGIGLSLVRQLLQDKIKVIAIVRDKSSLEELSKEYPLSLQIIEANLSSPEDTLRIVQSVAESRIHYLVHNAAIIEPLGKDALLDAPISALRQILEVNLIAPIILTASLHSKLAAGCRVLNVSSRAGEKAGSGLGMYCISKAALDMYTESLQLDCPHGILCASVHPGEVDTGMQGELRVHDETEFPYANFFQRNLKDNKLLSPDIAAKYLKWLLLKNADEDFVKVKHNIYDSSHHLHWHTELITCPY